MGEISLLVGFVIFIILWISGAVYGIRKLKQAFALAKEQGIEIIYTPSHTFEDSDLIDDILYDPSYSSCPSNIWYRDPFDY